MPSAVSTLTMLPKHSERRRIGTETGLVKTGLKSFLDLLLLDAEANELEAELKPELFESSGRCITGLEEVETR